VDGHPVRLPGTLADVHSAKAQIAKNNRNCCHNSPLLRTKRLHSEKNPVDYPEYSVHVFNSWETEKRLMKLAIVGKVRISLLKM
jgi:hypothetical protein